MAEPRTLRTRDLLSMAALVILFYVAWEIRASLLFIYVGLIFAIVFEPAVEWVRRLRIHNWSPGRGMAILILLAGVLVTLGGFVALAVPPISHDAQQLTSQLPQSLAQLRDKLRGLPFGNFLASHINTGSLQQGMQSIAASTLGLFRGISGGVMAIFTIALVAAYFILDGRKSFEWALSFVPEPRRPRLRDTLLRAKERVQRWLVGQLLLMAILGSLTAIALGIMGVRYFYVIAVFAGLANFIPILGPIATVIIAALIAALDSWMKVLGVVLFYLAYQQVENAYLTPRIMKSTVHLPGIVVIIALVIGGSLAGLLGAMVAVPTAALLGTLINEYGRGHQQQQPSARKPGHREAA